MSKYHDIKNKYTLSIEEEKEYKKSSIAKMIEESHKKGEKLPDIVIKNTNFIEGFYLDYFLQTPEYTSHMIEKMTIAQNIIESLPFEFYKEYMDITWLKTFDEDSNRLINSLVYKEKNDVILHFLELISQENKKDDFKREVFEPIFNLNHHLYNLVQKDSSFKAVKNYFHLFKKALEVYEPFYLETCKSYKVKPKEIKKWHKDYEYLTMLHKDTKLHEINLYLLKHDETLEILKDVFNQYDNPKDNLMLSKEYFNDAVKNGSEKIVTYYIAELLKHNVMTQEQIENEIVKAFHEKITYIRSEISESFKNDYKNDYSNTYNIESVYNIAIKYGNYQPDYKKLSELLLIDNEEFQNNFLLKILNEDNIVLSGLNIDQWKILSQIVEQVKEITGKGLQQSAKQREGRYPKEAKDFVNEHPYEIIYKINRINKLFIGKGNPISEKELDKIYTVFKSEVSNKMLDPTFDMDKFRLNNRLQERFEQKGKAKAAKI